MIRFNNPFNIRWSHSNSWLGEGTPHRGFCTFDTLEHGIRAFLLVIRSYILKHGIKRICDIVSRYAPPSENQTLAYIMYVCGDDFHDDTQVDNLNILCVIAQRMAYYESNTFIYQDTIYRIAKSYHIFDHVFASC